MFSGSSCACQRNSSWFSPLSVNMGECCHYLLLTMTLVRCAEDHFQCSRAYMLCLPVASRRDKTSRNIRAEQCREIVIRNLTPLYYLHPSPCLCSPLLLLSLHAVPPLPCLHKPHPPPIPHVVIHQLPFHPRRHSQRFTHRCRQPRLQLHTPTRQRVKLLF